MDPASMKMEEIYSVPIKYTESWLEMKDSKGFIEYWVVLKTHYMFFFKDQNTHCKDQHVGYINIEVGETKCTSKKGSKTGKCDFMLEMSKKKFLFRVRDDILRKRWMYAIGLVATADTPGPLPGDLDFKERTVFTPSPGKMKPRGNSIAVIRTDLSDTSISRPQAPNDLSLQLYRRPSIKEEEEAEESYEPVYIPPSYYFGNLTRNGAVQLLDPERIGTYLLRDTESSGCENHFSLSIKDISRIKHHKIHPLNSGECFFDGAANAPFPTPTDAVSYLMKTKYLDLKPRPLPNNDATVRCSGDGQEDLLPGSKQTEANNHSPVTPSFGGHFPGPQPLLPLPPDIPIAMRHLPPPPEIPTACSPPSPRHVMPSATLPARFKTKELSLPGQPIYQNLEAIKSQLGLTDGSYVNMERTFKHDSEDTPPPLPRKRGPRSKGDNNNSANYVSSRLCCENDSESEYECPVPIVRREQWNQRRESLP